MVEYHDGFALTTYPIHLLDIYMHTFRYLAYDNLLCLFRINDVYISIINYIK